MFDKPPVCSLFSFRYDLHFSVQLESARPRGESIITVIFMKYLQSNVLSFFELANVLNALGDKVDLPLETEHVQKYLINGKTQAELQPQTWIICNFLFHGIVLHVKKRVPEPPAGGRRL